MLLSASSIPVAIGFGAGLTRLRLDLLDLREQADRARRNDR
jgi:hypothetical protein